MDLVGFDASTFERSRETFVQFAGPLGFEGITAIPLSALNGDNVTERSKRTPWYAGPTLMEYLEAVQVQRGGGDKLVFPVQRVNRATRHSVASAAAWRAGACDRATKYA